MVTLQHIRMLWKFIFLSWLFSLTPTITLITFWCGFMLEKCVVICCIMNWNPCFTQLTIETVAIMCFFINKFLHLSLNPICKFLWVPVPQRGPLIIAGHQQSFNKMDQKLLEKTFVNLDRKWSYHHTDNKLLLLYVYIPHI